LFKNNREDEADFCESYKSQILNQDTEEDESSIVSILTILFLLGLIIALSIFGYNYIMDNKSSDTSASVVNLISDDDLKVTEEDVSPNQLKKEIKRDSVKLFKELPKSESLDVNDLADQIKIDMSENEEEKKKVEVPLFSVSDSLKSTYVEDLAKLTAEIDKEKD